jgi:hypothetical protein
MRSGPPSGSIGVGSIADSSAASVAAFARAVRLSPLTFWKASNACQVCDPNFPSGSVMSYFSSCRRVWRANTWSPRAPCPNPEFALFELDPEPERLVGDDARFVVGRAARGALDPFERGAVVTVGAVAEPALVVGTARGVVVATGGVVVGALGTVGPSALPDDDVLCATALGANCAEASTTAQVVVATPRATDQLVTRDRRVLLGVTGSWGCTDVLLSLVRGDQRVLQYRSPAIGPHCTRQFHGRCSVGVGIGAKARRI